MVLLSLYFSSVEASSQSVESISLIDLEKSIEKPFIYTIEASFQNPFIISGGKAVLYQPTPNSMEIYNYFTNTIVFKYSTNGMITSVDEDGSLLAVGTERGEVILIDESSNYSARRFEAGFGAVSHIQVLSGRYVFALFSDGIMTEYDTRNDSWISYRTFSVNSSTENVQQYQVLDLWKDGGTLLLLCSPSYSPIGKIYLQLVPQTNETAVSGVRVVVNFTDTGFTLSGTTDSEGYIEFGVPPGENTSSTVSIYISSQKAGFFYNFQFSLGDLMNKLTTIAYPPSAQLVSLTYIANNYVLYSAVPVPFPEGLKVTGSFPFSADNVFGIKVEDGSLGFRYMLLISSGGQLVMERLTKSLQLTGKDTYYRADLSSFDADSSGSFIALGFSDGTLISLELESNGYKVFHSYKLTSSPSIIRIESSSPLSIIAYDGSYLSALIYSAENLTLWPILRSENSLGYYVGASLALPGTDDTMLFFFPSYALVIDGLKEIFSFNTLDLRTRTLATLSFRISGEDRSIPGELRLLMSGGITYSATGNGSSPIIMRNVLPGNYTLTVYPSQNIYDPVTVPISIAGSGVFNVSLPLHQFNLTVSLTDALSNGPPKGTFSYSLSKQGVSLASGTWDPSSGVLNLNATYGSYTLTLNPQFSSIYPAIQLPISVPDNTSILLTLQRQSYLYGVQVIDASTKNPASGTFEVTVIDTMNRTHTGVTDYGTIAYISMDDVGNMTIIVTPSDSRSSQMYYPVETSAFVSIQMVNPVLVQRRNYTLAITVMVLDTKIPATGATVKVASYSATVGPNGTVSFILPADTYTVYVQGGIYVSSQKAVDLYSNSSVTIGVRRIVGTLTVKVSQPGGTPLSNAYVSIDGIDNVNSFTFITDITGEITTNVPLGLYKITVSAPDYVTQVQVWNISSPSPQTLEFKMSYTPLGYFKVYGIYVLIIAVAVVVILYMRRYVKKRLDLLTQRELEEEVF